MMQVKAEQEMFLRSGITLDVKFRIRQLKRLKEAIKAHDVLIYDALKKDLNKPVFESYVTELGSVYGEIDYMIKHVKEWAKPKRVPTSLAHFYSKSHIYQEPYGRVLIIAPWNFPIQLSFVPLVGAIAAGNCVVLKPSELAPYTARVIQQIIESVFAREYVAVEQGDGKVSQQLLKDDVDYCFFTGSTQVGKAIMETASQTLTPVTLELGGKSPVIVAKDTNIKHAAQRVVWGKFTNAGQTCIAPDYLLVDEVIRDDLISAIIEVLEEYYTKKPLENSHYSKMINKRHFKRVKKLMKNQSVIYGGGSNKEMLTIEPTLVLEPELDTELMQEEIFGPILPILTYREVSQAVEFIRSKDKPLALYLFTQDKALKEYIINNLSFGGAAINDTLIHQSNYNLPFGGVGASGMGQYHGKYSLETFSHPKSVIEKTDLFDIKLRYPPYKEWALKFIKKIM
ncbi:aldehyde dehydrogenase [Aerococcaceae bacterium INB8]|uniref:Aldehyde dehydrogenase n=1 Tax=Ruoffia halotolerans TaxID=2748684 RepID=A0A839A3H2_9LACT|nr:aldehyde dehydrogenase [Ruoffia halotolerans]MBA5728502.1 aldehyde dehydrogenase [Ruoffia halotolerans]